MLQENIPNRYYRISNCLEPQTHMAYLFGNTFDNRNISKSMSFDTNLNSIAFALFSNLLCYLFFSLSQSNYWSSCINCQPSPTWPCQWGGNSVQSWSLLWWSALAPSFSTTGRRCVFVHLCIRAAQNWGKKCNIAIQILWYRYCDISIQTAIYCAA